ncbi:MAG: purine-binding chemotaxis protein CheW, partial [Candidatus Dadabacteria bacterium]
MSLKQKKDGILLETGTNEAEFLQFYLGKQRFGVNVAKVRQIVVFKDLELVSLPNSNKVFLGTVYVRGQQVGVINLGEFLKIKDREENDKELLLICEFDRRTTGFIIDNVEAIYRCSWEEFQPVGSASTVDQKYLVGSLIIGEEIVFILDLESIMGELNPEINIATYASKVDFKDKSCSDVKVL